MLELALFQHLDCGAIELHCLAEDIVDAAALGLTWPAR